uniref:Superoxide dismutase n=1 Tax=Romanomermis culicivorax TaxID=13658 RepID=A0A915JDX1_ROMCU
MDDGGRGPNNTDTLTTGNSGARFACGVIAISSDFSSVIYNGGACSLNVQQSTMALAALTSVLVAFLLSR